VHTTSDNKNSLPDIQLARALRMAANPIFIVNKGGVVTWCNQAYANTLGLSIEEVAGHPAAALTPTRETTKFLMDLWKVVMEGQTWFGELVEHHRSGRVINMDAVLTPLTDANGRATMFLVLEHDITSRKLTYEQVWQLANHDRLTGLANRSSFTSVLERAITKAGRDSKKTAVFFIDLDGFKAVNDTFGHDAGDQVLVEVARILKSCVRKSDSVARFGGDEFACILDEVETLEDATRVAQKIIESVATIDQVGASHVKVGASIGIAMYPMHGLDEAALRSAADKAMYAVKKAGKNSWKVAESLTDAL
jgi:diguanylate cyclase (GGDEF)-like protein/PAS domain S-box-containing protein